MEEFIEALEKLYERKDIPMNGRYFGEDETTIKAECMACKILITDNGGCDWDNICKVSDFGYSVFCGEGDSFGWLTGCIQKHGDKRILVYG